MFKLKQYVNITKGSFSNLAHLNKKSNPFQAVLFSNAYAVSKQPTATNKKSERLILSTAISDLVAKQDSFSKAVETLSELNQESLTKLDLEIDAKKKELDLLEGEVQRKLKDNEILVDQSLKQYQYEEACKILTSRDEFAMKKNEFEEKESKLKKLEADRTEEMEQLKKTTEDKGRKALEAALTANDLKHKAEVAELSAACTQQTREIANLVETIGTLKTELAAQRNLTKDVAESSRPPAINVHSSK